MVCSRFAILRVDHSHFTHTSMAGFKRFKINLHLSYQSAVMGQKVLNHDHCSVLDLPWIGGYIPILPPRRSDEATVPLLTNEASRRWMPTKMVASRWRRCRTSCREPGDRFRSSRALEHQSDCRVEPSPCVLRRPQEETVHRLTCLAPWQCQA